MERRFAARMQEALEGAIVDARVFRDVQPRLENFLQPFVACLQEAEQKGHARRYVTGLLSDRPIARNHTPFALSPLSISNM